MKRAGFTVVMAAMLLGACGGTENVIVSQTPFIVTQVNDEDALLPAPYTMDNLQQSLDEYINYRLWYYPENTTGALEENVSFDSYIGKSVGQSIDIEIRSYEGNVYASLPTKEWLIPFSANDGIVYTEGEINSEQQAWPESDYTSIGSFSLKVNEPRSPVFGSSVRKDKMVEASLAYLDHFYDDVSRQGEEEAWAGTTATLVDFYESQMATAAWLVRKDGEIYHVPMYFEEEEAGITAVGMKGFRLNDVEAFGVEEGYRFRKELEDAQVEVKFAKGCGVQQVQHIKAMSALHQKHFQLCVES
ncbi:hypothetical protein ACX93W_26030 [Paenibacillus sp. CAU 1782]